MNFIWLFLFVFSCMFNGAACDHFAGAIFQWEPTGSSSEVAITMRIAWSRSQQYCDEQTISDRSWVGVETLICISGCNTSLGSLFFRCTNFSEVNELTTGLGSIEYAPENDVFSFGFTGAAWNTKVVGGTTWQFVNKANVSVRTDTGTINRAPRIDVPLFQTIEYGCFHTIAIPVSDADGDAVRCRFAESSNVDQVNECGSICNGFQSAGASIDPVTCTITYDADDQETWYAVSIQVEDFASADSTTPLSSVAAQFIISVANTSTLCPECRNLTAPENGNVVLTNTSYRGVAEYFCDTGYNMTSGDKTRSCQADGLWNGEAPTCTIIDCGNLTVPVKGSVSVSSTTYMGEASHSCFKGYYVTSGNISRYCQADGTWSGTTPTCTIRDCGKIDVPENGHVSVNSTHYGGVAILSCDTGFNVTSGNRTRTCQSDGIWSGKTPTCTIRDCGNADVPENGQVSVNSTHYGGVAIHSCDTGFYVTSGNRTRICQSDGTWSGTIPTCTIRECRNLTAPDNGHVMVTSTLYRGVAEYSCDTGYIMTPGSKTRSCKADGSWDGEAPTCTIIDCGNISIPVNGSVSVSSTTYMGEASHSCFKGYYITSGNISRYCQADGTWSGTTPTCTIRDCGNVDVPENGQVFVNSTHYGGVAIFSCDTGYNATSGNKTRTCQTDGTWDGVKPTCSNIDCGSIADPESGNVLVNSTRYGGVAVYSCMTGYNITAGSNIRTCQSNGIWSGVKPTCSIIECGNIASPENGNVTVNSTNYGGEAVHSCRTAYNLTSGNEIRTCQSNGTWSGVKPTCSIIAPLFAFGKEMNDSEIRNADDTCSEPIFLPFAIPVFDISHHKVFVCTNGIVSFGDPYTNPTPRNATFGFGERTIIAPFFSDTDTGTSGTVYYRVLDLLRNASKFNSSEVKDVERRVEQQENITGFEASFILFVTWHDVKPFQNVYKENSVATFQLLMVSSGTDTFALFGYGKMEWTLRNAHGSPDVWIGYFAGKNNQTNIYSFTTKALSMDRYAVTNGENGIIIYRLTQPGHGKSNSAINCLKWYNENKGKKKSAEDASKRLPSCPCSLTRLTLDPSFPLNLKKTRYPDIECVDINYAKTFNLTGKSCCYDVKSGMWTQEKPYAGGFQQYHPFANRRSHEAYDLHSKLNCCDESNNCHLYYDLHPVGECQNKASFTFGTSWGDPHFKTLDGKNFTFNGLGEYILLKVNTIKSSFELQARTERAVRGDGSLSDATIFSAFVAKESHPDIIRDVKDGTIQVELNDTKDGLIIYANGRDLTEAFVNNKNFLRLSNNPLLLNRNGTLVISFPNIGVSLNISIGVKMLTLKVVVPNSFSNNTRGLLGNFDNDPNNDYILPNGSVKKSAINDSEIFEYGQTWAVNGNTTLFTYESGKGYEDYQNASFTPVFNPTKNQDQINAAHDICGPEEQSVCIFDYLATNDSRVANDTGTTSRITERDEAELSTDFPRLSGCNNVYVQTGTPTVCEIETEDDENISITLNKGSDDAFVKNNTLVINTNKTEPLTVSVTAVDIRTNKTSPEFHISMTFCSGCSGHGKCILTEERPSVNDSVNLKLAQCQCDFGYDGDNCERPFDGCKSEPCSTFRTCVTLDPGSQQDLNRTHNCSKCPPGFIDVDEKCEDIDECENGTCEQICLNTEGSFTCSCENGYRQNQTDVTKCKDIDECEERTHNCSHQCKNTMGGYICECFSGYKYDQSTDTCIQDTAESPCENSRIDCSQAAGCSRGENGDPVCFCENGFLLTENNTCQDIDECSASVCPHNCNNFEGGYKCICYDGYRLSGPTTCTPCEPLTWGYNCSNTCTCTGQGVHSCHPVRGCVCRDGWQGNTCNDDINECVTDPDICKDVRKECVNKQGSYFCKCRHGYLLNNSGLCEDINECASSLRNDCEQECENSFGGYSCKCGEGYIPINETHCKDIDECESQGSGCEHACENYPGRYNCYCHNIGFRLNSDRKTCTKISDPCKELFNLTCDHLCKVESNQAYCVCNLGYSLAIDNTTCQDIDECSLGLNQCVNATCKNTPGSYICQCAIGHRLENDNRTCTECDEFHFGNNCQEECNCIEGKCDKEYGCKCDEGWTGASCDEDIDECAATSTDCTESNTVCKNTFGGFFCSCKLGYTNISGGCQDIDECKMSHTCDQKCINTDGSYTCTCENGYIMIDEKCEDINECVGINDCDHNCENTIGGYRCSCDDGFKLHATDGRSCIAKSQCDIAMIEKCSLEKGVCFVNNNKSGCICMKGYASNGTHCEDIDECKQRPRPCKRDCVNKDGGFQCRCPKGFELDVDKSSCKECDAWSYGDGCKEKCICNQSSTESCNANTGQCVCKTGWTGYICDEDIDECLKAETDGTKLCPLFSDCVNVAGSFACICHTGYQKTAAQKCEVCDRNHWGLNCKQTCPCEMKNTAYCDHKTGHCICKSGWTSNYCTADLNECLDENACSHKDNSKCRNVEGSYVCECTDGYTELGDDCVDVNECLDRKDICNHRCINTPGSYICRCKTGYVQSMNKCTECTNNTYGENCMKTCSCNLEHAVDRNQACHTANGMCFCTHGWSGASCENDVNECDLDSAICDEYPNTGCHNKVGGYMCGCLRGFEEKEGVCVSEPEPSQTPPKDGQKEVTMMLRMGVQLPHGTNLQVKASFDEVAKEVEKSLTIYLREFIQGHFEIYIDDLKLGSLEVHFRILLDDNENNDQKLLTAAEYMNKQRTLKYKNSDVNITTDLPTSICGIRLKLFGDCSEGTVCVTEEGNTVCRKRTSDKSSSLSIIAVSAPVIVFVVLFCIVCTRSMRVNKKLRSSKENSSHDQENVDFSDVSQHTERPVQNENPHIERIVIERGATLSTAQQGRETSEKL